MRNGVVGQFLKNASRGRGGQLDQHIGGLLVAQELEQVHGLVGIEPNNAFGKVLGQDVFELFDHAFATLRRGKRAQLFDEFGEIVHHGGAVQTIPPPVFGYDGEVSSFGVTEGFATEADYAECSRIHRRLGTTFFFASRRLPVELRQRVDAVYAFVRFEPSSLKEVRQELIAATYGMPPSFGWLRAFADVMRETGMALDEPIRYLDALELEPTEFATFEELKSHVRNEAGSIAAMMLHVLGEGDRLGLRNAGQALAVAMKLTNHLRNIGPDALAGRVMLPLDEMARFGVTVGDLEQGRVSKGFVDLLRLQISRVRGLYRESDAGIPLLREDMKFGVALARDVYEKMLDKIDENGYDVFRKSIRTTPQEKMVAAWTLWSGNSASDEA